MKSQPAAPNDTKKLGRPERAKIVEMIQIVQTPACPACPACGVTDGTNYRLVPILAYTGTTSSGREYSHIINRRTMRKDCSKVRIDKYFENHVPEGNPGDENEQE